MLRRRVSGIGNPPAPVLHIPSAFARLEGIYPGTEVAVLFDQGVLLVTTPGREDFAAQVLRALRIRSSATPGGDGS